MQSTDLVAQLRFLNSEVTALLILAHRLAEQIRWTIGFVEPPADGPALREAGRRYLATASNAELRRALIEVRGSKAAANFRTRLNSDLEARNGRRHPVNGQARVHDNGAGTAL
jgi:hypothetical protein